VKYGMAFDKFYSVWLTCISDVIHGTQLTFFKNSGPMNIDPVYNKIYQNWILYETYLKITSLFPFPHF